MKTTLSSSEQKQEEVAMELQEVERMKLRILPHLTSFQSYHKGFTLSLNNGVTFTGNIKSSLEDVGLWGARFKDGASLDKYINERVTPFVSARQILDTLHKTFFRISNAFNHERAIIHDVLQDKEFIKFVSNELDTNSLNDADMQHYVSIVVLLTAFAKRNKYDTDFYSVSDHRKYEECIKGLNV